MAVAEGQPVIVHYAKDFVSMDQAVSDLEAPRPETRWCLMELPKDQLAALEAGQRFYFQELSGAEVPGDGFAALCTKTGTFGVEFLENSNSILIGKVEKDAAAGGDADGTGAADDKPAMGRCTVFAQCRGQLIVKAENVDTNKVRELLAPSALGKVDPADDKLYDIAALLYEVAGSEEELAKVLAEGPYVEVAGKWRLLPDRLEKEVLEATITVITARGWKPEAVNANDLFEEVQRHVRGGKAAVPNLAVLRKALKQICADKSAAEAVSEGKEADKGKDTPAKGDGEKAAASDESLFVFDKQKMNFVRALQHLREPPQKVREQFQLPAPEAKPSAAKRPRLAAKAASGAGSALHLDEFTSIYKEISETEISSEDLLKMLGNLVYIDDFEGTIHALDATALPRDPHERLKRLFEMQTHWRPERLAALLTPALKGIKVDPWLMAWARQVFVELEPGNEVRMLTKKFG
eukprot:TRINITY_DN79024_c0_g1_i1.p1 TRINITY_DN79024_c0_g1~~TRINITY_DN79024_c0_g1_i1.p1  ORF type:complete len:465 (+),score=137.95 TRINITY_DN79024_c0_g1_i1:31-1425(+)